MPGLGWQKTFGRRTQKGERGSPEIKLIRRGFSEKLTDKEKNDYVAQMETKWGNKTQKRKAGRKSEPMGKDKHLKK